MSIKKRKDKRIRSLNNKWKFFILSIFILIAANTFNGLLSISSFENIYADSVVSLYIDAGFDLQRSIERPILFGKPLHKFYGINTILEQFKKKHPGIADIRIATPDGNVLYQIGPKKTLAKVPSYLIPDFSDENGMKDSYDKKYLNWGMYHIFLPLKDRKKNIIGLINMTFKESIIKNYINQMIKWNLKKLLITSLVVSILLFLVLAWFIDFNNGIFKRKKLYYLLFVFLATGQLIYSYYNISYFQQKYIDIVRLKTLSTQNHLKADIEKILKAGVKISKLNKMDDQLKSVADSAPYINNIQILDPAEQVLYTANNISTTDPVKNKEGKYRMQHPIVVKGEIKGYFKTDISKKVVQKKILEIVLDSFTVFLISLIFTTELLFFMFIII